jgi:phage gp36-like protein
MPDAYAYITADDLTARYGALAFLQVTDRDGDGVADPGVVAAAIADTTELVDGFLGERYTLPLSPASGLVTGWAAAIAWFRLNLSPSPEVRTAYEDAMDGLDRVRTGKLILQSNGVAAAATPETGAVAAVDGAPRVFSHRSLRGY